jgi:probable HAF family extracellular repeat protein
LAKTTRWQRWSIDSNGVNHGFLYSHGNYITLNDPLAGGGQNQGTFALGINDLGQIIGGYIDANGLEHGFIYNVHKGTYKTLDDPLGTNGTEVDGINDLGKIVGIYTDSNGVNHGFHAHIG